MESTKIFPISRGAWLKRTVPPRPSNIQFVGSGLSCWSSRARTEITERYLLHNYSRQIFTYLEMNLSPSNSYWLVWLFVHDAICFLILVAGYHRSISNTFAGISCHLFCMTLHLFWPRRGLISDPLLGLSLSGPAPWLLPKANLYMGLRKGYQQYFHLNWMLAFNW